MNRPAYPPGHSAADLRSRTGQPSPRTSRLLLAGICAGPFLIGSSLLQGSIRAGFDFQRHPPSALALGSAGAVQQATFVLSGLLIVVGALGMRHGGVGRWAPRSMALLGGALAAAGLFRMDPAFGFPPGTPPGIGDTVSWHAAVHGVLFPVGFVALVATAVLMGRWYGRARRRGMQLAAYAAAFLSLVLSIWPNLGDDPEGRFLPMWLGVAIGYSWTSLTFIDLRRQIPEAGGTLDAMAAGA